MPHIFQTNPTSGTLVFGQVARMVSRGIVLEAGEIKLFSGRHLGPNRGFGCRHIWAEHQKEMADVGLTLETEVPEYVCRIVASGTPLYFEGGWGKVRMMAVRGNIGTAILEYRDQRNSAFWSVVTAYSANRKHGTLVGTVL